MKPSLKELKSLKKDKHQMTAKETRVKNKKCYCWSSL